jgi:hypothetical protein
MPDEFNRPPRHSVAATLLWDFMSRTERTDGLYSSRTPILLLTGVRGSGKTELLTDLRGLLGENFPHAHINGEWSFNSTTDMLALLAFELNQQHGYGKLAFPRLVTGEIVVRLDIAVDPLDRDHSRNQMATALADHRKVKGVLENSVRAILRGALTPVRARGPVTPAIGKHSLVGRHGAVAEELLGPFAGKRRERAHLLEAGLQWWGHQDRGLGNDPIDELISLRMDAERARAQRQAHGAGRRSESGDSRRVVIKRLWAAFLADLRDNFSDRRRAINWTRNCVLLLDNADTPAARAFLEELVSVRKDREPGEPDPLTVVATSRGTLTSRVPAAGLTRLDEAGLAHYGTRTGAAAWWYPVLLPPLNWSQTSAMVDSLRLPGAHAEAVTAAVHGFTCGHPAATSTLLAAIAANPEFSAEVNPSALLASKDLTEVAEHERTVEDALLDGLLVPSPIGDQAPAEDLTTCAAARHKEVALRLATDSHLLEQLPGEVTSIFGAEYWPVDPASGRAALHPLLRRLLLRRLADRKADATASWARVHLWLRLRALRDGQADAALYHTLALAGTDQDELAELLVRPAAEQAAAGQAAAGQAAAGQAAAGQAAAGQAAAGQTAVAEPEQKTAHEDRAGHPADPVGEKAGAHERPAAYERPAAREKPAGRGKSAAPREADPLEFEKPLEHVARQLAGCLRSDAATWLRRVAGITSSPTRLDLARKPRDQAVMLTEWVDKREEPLAPVARYVVYSWLGADPLSAPHWSWLLSQMAGELDLISRYSDDGGLSVLRAEAERYRNLADGSWRDIEDFWLKRTESADDMEASQGEFRGN